MLTLLQIRALMISTLIALLFALLVARPAAYGVFQESSNGHYHFAGGAAPRLLSGAIWLAVTYLLLLFSVKSIEEQDALPGLVRRFFGFFLDFVVAMLIFAPIVAIPVIFSEWKRTGAFQWTFERDFPVATDSHFIDVEFPVILLLVLIYFALPLVLRKPSPGTCILGYQIVPEGTYSLTFPEAILRVLLGGFALSFWPFAGIARDRQNGKFWVDRVIGTRAVRIR